MKQLNSLVKLIRAKRKLTTATAIKPLGGGRYRVRIGAKRASIMSGLDRDISPGARVTIAESADGRKTIVAARQVQPRETVEIFVRG